MTEARKGSTSVITEPSGEALSPARRQPSRPWVSAQRERLIAVAALGGIYGIAALAYWWTRAPLYNPPGTIDPWLYTAFFVNFDRVYEDFALTYYAARLPWIVPGRIAYAVFPLDAAYWVLHGLAFMGGVAALFFLAAGISAWPLLWSAPRHWP